jgi:hypothetical protein
MTIVLYHVDYELSIEMMTIVFQVWRRVHSDTVHHGTVHGQTRSVRIHPVSFPPSHSPGMYPDPLPLTILGHSPGMYLQLQIITIMICITNYSGGSPVANMGRRCNTTPLTAPTGVNLFLLCLVKVCHLAPPPQ